MFVTAGAKKIFKALLFLTNGLPIMLIAFLWIFLSMLALSGLDIEHEITFPIVALLFVSALYFFPVHFLFSEAIMPLAEFGPTPNIFEFLFTFAFYALVSYAVSNLVGYVFREGNRS